MKTLPIALTLAAYIAGSYAVVLFKGWNITIGEWINPLRGFTWPATLDCIPDTQIFPGGTGVACGGGTASTADNSVANSSKLEQNIHNETHGRF